MYLARGSKFKRSMVNSSVRKAPVNETNIRRINITFYHGKRGGGGIHRDALLSLAVSFSPLFFISVYLGARHEAHRPIGSEEGTGCICRDAAA